MRSNAPDSPLSALLLSPCPPDEGQKLRMEQVLAKRFGCPVTLTWQEDRTTAGGFRRKSCPRCPSPAPPSSP